MTADRMENYNELVERYDELIDDSHKIFQDFSSYVTEAGNTLRNGGDPDYLKSSLAASGATAAEAIDAKEDLDTMIKQLKLDELDTLEDFIESVFIQDQDQVYEFKHQSQYAIMEALITNQQKLMQVDEQYHRATSLEADLGNISFKIAL